MEKPFYIDLDGQQKELTPDNCGVSMFRHAPDNDYLDYWEFDDEADPPAERHWWVFNHREFLIWMGGVALSSEDHKMLRLANRTHGKFPEKTGWRPTVSVNDSPETWEEELFVRYVTGDIDQEWRSLDS